MRWSNLSRAAAAVATLSLVAPGTVQATQGARISGPRVHENLAVYFIHGKSAPGKVPLTLAEAMAKGLVQVRETGSVNQLEIENRADEAVFIQSGDIVKGGRQDRVLTVSLLLPPHSGRVPIASFCVEHGRWSARGREDARKFSTSVDALPSREMKLAMKAPLPTAPATNDRPRIPDARPHSLTGSLLGHYRYPSTIAETSVRQAAVWAGVRETQANLAQSLGSSVASARSASSLQLALENKRLLEAQNTFVAKLKAAGEQGDDILGYVFAINGKINSADVYLSNGLFRKMWPKLLRASAVEAIMHRVAKHAEAPTVAAVMAFLDAAEHGKTSERPLNDGVKLTTHVAAKAYLFETDSPAGWVHRNYLAK
jgi:ARG and Rhodanese-Phosphatase-superfamily-associated Protein domain